MTAATPATPQAPAHAALRAERRHRGWVAAIFVLAVITGLIAILSTWVRRQALDTSNWTNTSSKLLANKNVQNALGAYLVDQVFTNVDVAGSLRAALPSQADALAGPAAAGLRDLANQAAPQLLARPRVQDAWRQANRAAHTQLIQILNGGNRAVSTSNGEVVLDLHTLVTQLASTLGLSPPSPGAGAQARNTAQQKLGVTLPASSGKLVLMRSKQLKTAQDIAKLIRHVSIIFTIVSLGLFALAVALAVGWRRLALRTTGWCFVGLGLGTLIVRRVVGNRIVDGLVQAESVKPAAHDAWLIGTSLLHAIALAFVIYGLVIVAAAWLAGPTTSALAVRRALAPTLRDHPVRAYGVVAFVYLLVILWGPTPALSNFVPILIIGALLVLGIELLRHETAFEFPDAVAGDTSRRLRAWFAARRHGDAVPTDGQAPVGGARA
ncbi:MAG TPA: hypothetical protein VF032_17945 [Thermoleophilaceae bacterium]